MSSGQPAAPFERELLSVGVPVTAAAVGEPAVALLQCGGNCSRWLRRHAHLLAGAEQGNAGCRAEALWAPFTRGQAWLLPGSQV
jgi:hypothetical protein